MHNIMAQYTLVEITLLISPYKILSNDSNGHGCYFLQIIILIFE
jgi:hypothetical protein